MIYNQENRQKLLKLLTNHSGVTVVSHIRPDGDAIGSSLGIYHILKENGFKVEIVNYSKNLPKVFSFLDGFKKIKHKIDFKDSLIISCDSGSIDRLGFDLNGRTIVNIDHHKSNTNYGQLNIVDMDGVSTSEVAFFFLEGIFSISKTASEAFYTALLSDSQYFRTSSVTLKSFDLAKKLIERGVNPYDIAKSISMNRSLASLRLLERALSKLSLHLQAEVAVVEITTKDLAQTGADEYDRDGLVEYGRSLTTVKISILIIELGSKIKVSLRSKGINVLKIAMDFGGGGHKEASSFEIDSKKLSIKKIKFKVLEYIKNSGVLD